MRSWAAWKAFPVKVFTSWSSKVNSNLTCVRKTSTKGLIYSSASQGSNMQTSQTLGYRRMPSPLGCTYEKPDPKWLSSPGICLLDQPEVWGRQTCFVQQFHSHWRHPSTPPVLHLVLWGLWQLKACDFPYLSTSNNPQTWGDETPVWAPSLSHCFVFFPYAPVHLLAGCSLELQLWRMGLNWASKAPCLLGLPGQDWSVWGDVHFQFWGSFSSSFDP